MMRFLALILLVLGVAIAEVRGQLPVEWFQGRDRATLDIQFFRYIQQFDGVRTRWLFFNRNRVAYDDNTRSFGFTEALSYNHEAWKGFAPVAVAQILSSDVLTKAGIQYVLIRPESVLFTWLVTETAPKPDIDLFMMLRMVPSSKGNLALFSQVESLATLPTDETKPRMLVQRFRVGLQRHRLQIGLGVDATQTGRDRFTTTFNPGGFVRYDFTP